MMEVKVVVMVVVEIMLEQRMYKRSSVDLSGHCGPGAPPHPGLTDLPDGRGSTIRGEEGYRGESPQPAPLYVIYDEPNNSVGVKRNSFRGE
ncbi:hypothetical protein Pmani_038417 [Petrolisthes manimaculis]|uniref:Uncharacterized protein n=1 Tax=Petrolisthes manimaculis TaxID=1843537 RepID=A0AAE1TK96_9EUCA|nr:hypothetical protein Pmani_038417 [Petrolisthes manimaculis]